MCVCLLTFVCVESYASRKNTVCEKTLTRNLRYPHLISVRPSVRSFVRSFVSLSVVFMSVKGVHTGIKSGINYYIHEVRSILRKFIKTIATRCHILRLRCSKFDSRRLSVRPSVRFKLHLRDGRTSVRPSVF